MRIISVLVIPVILVLSGGCSLVEEKDLTGLESASLFDRRQVIEKIAQSRIPTFFFFKACIDPTRAKRAGIIITRLLREGDDDRQMQLSMLDAIEKLAHYVDVPVRGVIENLDHEDSGVRAKAVQVLAGIGGESATSALIEVLQRENHNYSVIWALGERGDDRAVPELNRLLASEDEYVSYNAYRALEKIAAKTGDRNVSTASGTQIFPAIEEATLGRYEEAMRGILNGIVGFKKARAGLTPGRSSG
jgi:hypothetical protein